MRILLLTAIALVALWLGGFAWFVSLIPVDPFPTDARPTDAIVVLTGGGLRLEHGLKLLEEGKAPLLFVSGVEDNVTLPSLLKTREYRPYLAAARGHVELGHKARTTSGNAEETAEWIRAHHIASVRLVTGNYHMPRSVYELHQAIPEAVLIPEPVFPGRFGGNDWWQSADGVRLVISEYNKYLASVARHSLGL